MSGSAGGPRRPLSEAFLAQAQRLTRTGSLWWKPSTGEIVWSDENYRLMGYPVGVTPTVEMAIARCHPDDLELVQSRLGAAVSAGTQADFEHRLLMPDGEVKHVRIVFQNVAPSGEPPEFLGATIDITEWKLAMEQLRQTEAHLSALRSELACSSRSASFGTLTASIAHEVSQPLTGILANASTCLRLLTAEPPDLERARATAERTLRDTNRASEVIWRLRALFTRRPPAADPFDLNDATREAVVLWEREVPRRRAALRLSLADDLPVLAGDRIQIQQVILNLLRNASDATNAVTDRPTEIDVTTERTPDGGVRLSVRDTGVGFGPDGTDKLFTPFHTTKPEGMGVGLCVSRSIIESHRGRLSATAHAGPGATFALSLPPSLPGARR